MNNLSPTQEQFRRLISQTGLHRYWNWEKRNYDKALLKKDLPCMSHGEKVLVKFFVGLWTWDNELNFDIYEAANSLSHNNRAIIIEWLENPFWP